MVRAGVVVVVVVVLAWAVALLVTDGKGTASSRTALAVEAVDPIGFSATGLLHVECATHVDVEVRDDPAGSGLAEITVWGTPKAGRCQPDARVNLLDVQRWGLPDDAPPHTQFVDGATSQAIALDG